MLPQPELVNPHTQVIPLVKEEHNQQGNIQETWGRDNGGLYAQMPFRAIKGALEGLEMLPF